MTNVSAYSATSSAMKKKSFIVLPPVFIERGKDKDDSQLYFNITCQGCLVRDDQ